MKAWLRVLLGVTVLSALLLCPRGAFAQASGTIACTTDSDCRGTPDTPHCARDGTCVACVDFARNPCVPVACDGALCDTTNGTGCSTAGGVGGRRSGSAGSWVIILGALALAMAMARRRGRHAAERFR